MLCESAFGISNGITIRITSRNKHMLCTYLDSYCDQDPTCVLYVCIPVNQDFKYLKTPYTFEIKLGEEITQRVF